jgi:hypothetical protein
MHLSNFCPAGDEVYSESLHVISWFLVDDELGSEISSPSESIHTEAQGELGVTCNAMEHVRRSPKTHVSLKRAMIPESM